ncbi:Gmad2 immunoglobulin-like domain-containing protein [Alkalicoccus chagannorensis]|uniref:Gmad2 immunoglobulin-like domain-containing protein n=1 Tax=Alkalicoccus chagannorensis TaxID=427072 RepID=UPI0003FD043D|nr:Gmad2 immunoglobulin-like domain-containing protein [Alkalicoccus chagannorensis]
MKGILVVLLLLSSFLFALPASAETETIYENESFRIFSAEADDHTIHIEGEARVFEATVSYVVVENGTEILDGFTTATAGGPEWGEFDLEIDVVEMDEAGTRDLTVTLFEESAEDGSRTHELDIPITIGEEGDELPATATASPSMLLAGLALALAGILLYPRRRSTV